MIASKVQTHDGLGLDVFATERRFETTIVFVNALGMTSALVEPLASALFARGLNFVTWNGRGFPGPYDDSFRTYDTNHNVTDLTAVAASLGLSSFVLSAWCTGIHTALAFAAGAPERVRSLLLFNSPNYSGARLSGVTGDAIGKVSDIIVKDERKLDFFYSNIMANSTEEVRARMTGLPSGRMQEMVQAPFSSGKEALLRYAHLLYNSGKFDCAQTCRSITAPALIIGGRVDTMVSYKDSMDLAQLLPNGVAKIVDAWDHYSVFREPDWVAENIFASWLNGGEGRVPEAAARAPAIVADTAPQSRMTGFDA